MSRLARRLLILLAGPVSLTLAAAAPAFALGGVNHTEPFVRLPHTS